MNSFEIAELMKADASIARLTHRPAAVLPQTAAVPIFTVSGRVEVIMLLGNVTETIETQANATKFTANPTTGSDVDLCTATSITAAAVGARISITGTVANALVLSAAGAPIASQATRLIIEDGTIDMHCAASNDGEMEHFIMWRPLTEGAYVVAA